MSRSKKFRRILVAAVLGLLFPLQLSLAQDFVWAPDFPVGSTLPPVSAQDQNGNVRTFADLKGEKGLLFMMSRSFDW